MTGRDWQSGRAMCIHVLDAYVLGAPGGWRMFPTIANGQPAAVVYHRDADSALRADGPHHDRRLPRDQVPRSRVRRAASW